MGLFDFLKKKRSLDNEPAEKISKQFEAITNSPPLKPMADKEYSAMRSGEEDWFESHFDLVSVEGIKSIPNKKGLRCPKTTGVTGQLYYYLRRKAYDYEKAGNMELAVACMRKSTGLAKLDYGIRIQKEELYPLVKILARNGQVEEAIAEKEFVDQYCLEQQKKLSREIARQSLSAATAFNTDLVIMDAHGSTCPECAKYQGRVYSLSGKNRKFPKVPDFYYATGSVHSGCSHSFSPYIDGVNDPDLPYTLSVHPLQNKRYGKNIVAFSNRPFEDDRTKECKQAAAAVLQKQAEEREKQQHYEEHMIEIEAQRGQEARDYLWLQQNIPNKCPKSVTGYRRMKTQNTKNYQILKQLASEHGRQI